MLESSQMKTGQRVKYEEKINSQMNTFALYSSLRPLECAWAIFEKYIFKYSHKP